MTYCVAIRVDEGLCFVSDSRTNAGVDNVSTYSKMYVYDEPGHRELIVLSAGNLATTQGVIGRIKRDLKSDTSPNFRTFQSIEEVADYVGTLSLEQQEKHTGGGKTFEASFIVGGQIKDQKHEAYLVYPQGNHITTSKDTPFLQIGESKYGKPILDRIITPEVSLETAALCGLVSMDSTMQSNLTVGPPIEVAMYQAGALKMERKYRFEESSEYLRQVKSAWDQRLKEAFSNMPPLAWSKAWDHSFSESN
jgi:putative proteasome-type protease